MKTLVSPVLLFLQQNMTFDDFVYSFHDNFTHFSCFGFQLFCLYLAAFEKRCLYSRTMRAQQQLPCSVHYSSFYRDFKSFSPYLRLLQCRFPCISTHWIINPVLCYILKSESFANIMNFMHFDLLAWRRAAVQPRNAI